MRDPDLLDLETWADDDEEATAADAFAPPHVVHVTQYLTEGAAAFMRSVMAEVETLGWRQTLTLGRRADRAAEIERGIPCSVSLIELPDRARSKLRYARALARVLDEFALQPDPLVVHLHAVETGLIERVLLARLRRRALCYCTPDLGSLLNPLRPVARASHRVLERVAGRLPLTPVCRCVAVGQVLARAWGRPAYVVEEPIDDCFLDVVARDAEPPTVICVGRPAEHNAPDVFAQLALRFEIDEVPARFVWVGDGDAAQVARLRASAVDVVRCGSARELAQALAGASIFVQPSVWEGVPKSLIRAMAAGLPCVALDAPNHRDLIVHGRTGFLVRDLDDFDRHVRWLLTEPEARRWLGAAARRAVRARFARTRFRAALLRLYGQPDAAETGRGPLHA